MDLQLDAELAAEIVGLPGFIQQSLHAQALAEAGPGGPAGLDGVQEGGGEAGDRRDPPVRRELSVGRVGHLHRAERSGGPVSVVGWSLGGIYGRELARQHPKLVREVITLGSPFGITDPRQSRVDGYYQRRSHLHAAAWRLPTPEQVAQPIGVPSTAVFSRLDGVVSWQACVEPETALHQNVEVRCGHLGFGVDPPTLWVIANRLAAPAGPRGAFRPPLVLRPFYPARR